MKHVTHWCQALFFLVLTAFTIAVGATPIRITSANEVVIYFDLAKPPLPATDMLSLIFWDNAPQFNVTSEPPDIASLYNGSTLLGTASVFNANLYALHWETSTSTFNRTANNQIDARIDFSSIFNGSIAGMIRYRPGAKTSFLLDPAVIGRAAQPYQPLLDIGISQPDGFMMLGQDRPIIRRVLIDGVQLYPQAFTLSPTSGPVGSSIIIVGTGFGATQGSSTVQICGLTPTWIQWEEGNIAIGVPQIATGTVCNVRLTTGFGSSVGAFTVTARATLSGVVLDGSGKPLLGAGISLSGGPTPGAVLTDQQGHYTLPGLASGTYTVAPTLLGYQFSQPSQTISVNGSPVVASNFIGFLGKPVLTSTNPVRAQFATPPDPQTEVTINGYSFGSQNADSKVMFGNVVASVKPNTWNSPKNPNKIVVYLPPQPDPNVSIYGVTVFTTAGMSNVKGFSYKLKALQILTSGTLGTTTNSGLLAAPQDVLLPVYTQPSGATKDSVTQVITIQNNAKTWYYVKPASIYVSGSGLPTSAFLLGPGQQRSFGPLTFMQKGAWLQFFADNSLCGKTYSELFACARTEPQSQAILWALGMEVGWRMAFGSPAPIDIATSILDPTITGLSLNLYDGEAVSLIWDTVQAMNGDPYALAQLPTDVLGFMRTNSMTTLMNKYGVTGGIDPALLNWFKIVINTGITSKFLVETLIYPNTGTLTFQAQ